MNLPTQTSNRLLPFNRDSPRRWKEWEKFWVDLLNAGAILPWPGDKAVFKRVIIAQPYGIAGGAQDGIDITAEMDDHSILAIQCKDHQKLDHRKALAALNKAEKEFTKADAFYLVLTQEGVSSKLLKEAERRGNWRVIGRDTLSSWFFSGKFLPPDQQKDLIQSAFGPLWVRELFPLPGDDFLISAERFFQLKNLIRHDAQLQGKEAWNMVKDLAAMMVGSGPRIAILTATGGQGKTRMLKAVAELLAESSPERTIRFQNDAADEKAEDYGLRAEDFQNASIFIDDAHRLENIRSRLLKQVFGSPSATMLIAARPNNTEALKKKLTNIGFHEDDWKECPLPSLDWMGRRALAVEILSEDDGQTPDFLAEQSDQCPLICTVGAELIRNGKIDSDLRVSGDFKRRVFDHLMESSLISLFPDDTSERQRAERLLRIISMLNPIEDGKELYDQIAPLVSGQSWDIERLMCDLVKSGLLRRTRGKIRVIPDLLADHLVYDTAYGEGKMTTLVREVTSIANKDAFANLFGNLSEAEWRAKQEGKADTYLQGMWEKLREMLEDPEDTRIFGLLDAWRKFAIFQPERTLEIAQVFLDHETNRIASGIPEVRYKDYRYDSISMHLGKLPELLGPVARRHQEHRAAAFDLLWQLGCVKDGSIKPQAELPTAWNTIAGTASLSNWENGGPHDAFRWLITWARGADGKAMLEQGTPFLSKVASQWFQSHGFRSWKEGTIIQKHASDIEMFLNEALDWIESNLVPSGIGPCWAALPVIFAAGNMQAETRVATIRIVRMLREAVERYNDPLLRLTIWQFLSKRAAQAEPDEKNADWLALRNEIPRDLPFQLVRLAGSLESPEWEYENLKDWPSAEDHDTSAKWWSDLATQTVTGLRRCHSTIRKSMEEIDRANASLSRFGQRASWGNVADAWSKQFPADRPVALEEIMEDPEHALVPCLGYFIGPRDELDSDFAEGYILRALNHRDDRVRRAALFRLSWRDVKRNEIIAERLKEMAGNDDPAIVSAIAGFIVWNQYAEAPYLDEVLSVLNTKLLSTRDLAGVGEVITRLVKYSKHRFKPEQLEKYFQRLEIEGDLNAVFPDHVMSVFHEFFPVEMFRAHLSRVRTGKFLPWLLDGWFLSGLPKHLGHPAYQKTAADLFEETMSCDEDHFTPFSQLFDVSVARVDTKLAAHLLSEALRLHRFEDQKLERIIDLTGAGRGSVVYEAPEFTKELLTAIDAQPALKARELRDDLIDQSVPHSWGSASGEIEKRYLWAKDSGERMAEEFRHDSQLRSFYLDIVKHQERRATETRRRFLDE